MGNGARAAQKRERNAKTTAKGGDQSQRKTNQAAQSIKCKVCFQTFQSTTSRKDLDDHVLSRHGKTYEECFV